MYEPSDADIAAADAVLSESGELTEARTGGGLANVVKWLGKAGGAHPHSVCTAKFAGRVSNVDAFCAAAVDQLKGTTKWRGKEGAVDKFTESIEIRHEVEGTQGREWDILVIKPGVSKNGVLYEPSVLKAAAPLYEGAVSYDRHGTGEARSFKERIGRLHSVAYDTREGEEGIWARLRVIDPSVREKLLEAAEAGELQTVGFSHDVMAESEAASYQNRRVRKARKIESVNSVDMVERPSAGGRMSRLVAGDVEEGIGMDADEIKDLVATSVKEAMGAANIEMAKAIKEAFNPPGGRTQEQPTEITATTMQTGPEAGSLLSKELKEATEAANEALREATRQRQRNELLRQIEQTKLTEVGKKFLIARFEEAISRREVEDAEIKAMVGQEVEREAILQQGAANPDVPNGVRFQMVDRKEAFLKDFDAMFVGPSERLEPGVRPFSGFKEAYAKWGGHGWANEYEMMAESFPKQGYISTRDSQRIQESLNTATWGEVLADRLNRRMLAGYRTAPWYDKWRMFASEVQNVTDFRTQRWTRVGSYGDLPIVNEGATYQSTTSPGDEEETFAVAKRGFLDDITMEMIFNDDVGAVSRILREMGRAASRTLFRFVLNMITTTNPVLGDSVALYDNAHNNTGTTALSLGGVNTTDQAMQAQIGFGQSDPLGEVNKYKILIVPPELRALADRITEPSDQYLTNTSNAGTDTGLDPAMYKGTGRVVFTYHDLTDATDWFAVADPAMTDTVVVGFLAGRQEPEFFTQDQPQTGSVFSADKISYKTRFTFGGTILDYRSFYRQVVGG